MDTQLLSEENMPTFNFKSSFLKSAALVRHPEYMSIPELKEAAAGSAPREYPVKKDKEGFWYVMGLPGEELSEGIKDAPVVPTPNTWLNVHNEVKGLELAEQLYRELYAEFQTNDNLREGDVFSTPMGKFICQGVDVLPYDEPAKRIIGEVDDSYKCICGCDSSEHRRAIDENGFQYHAECSKCQDCKEYTKR
jgi:hypothetical protein